MFKRINILVIINAHLSTLRQIDRVSKGIYWKDLVLFFIIPIITSALLTWKNIDLTDEVANLITAFAILGGFLFNLLALIYNSMDKLASDVAQTNISIKKIFLKEIHANISFSILLSIFTVIFLLLYSYKYPNIIPYTYLKRGLLFINYFLLLLFFLTILMVLYRIFILLKKDVENINVK